MGFRLEVNEPIADGIKRIMTERIDRAIRGLVDPDINRDVGVHDARKCFKRERAVLRLVRFEIGEERYQAENIFFRDQSRRLAPARDSFVVVETLDTLVSHYKAEIPDGRFGSVREKLMARYKKISHQVLYESGAVEEVAATLDAAKARIETLPITRNKFSVLKPGIKKIYRQGQQGMIASYQEPEVEAFHDWRKRVKYLWYHLEIVSNLWPSLIKNMTVELKQLSDYLGDDHDLAVLRELLVDSPTLFDDDQALMLLLELIDRRRIELEAAAQPLGEKLYFDQPAPFVNRLHGYWRTWRTETNAEKVERLRSKVLADPKTELMASKGWFSTREISEFLQTTPAKVRYLIRSGKLPAHKVGATWLIPTQKKGEKSGRPEKLLSSREAAESLQISLPKLRGLIRSGELQATKVSGTWIIPNRAVSAFSR